MPKFIVEFTRESRYDVLMKIDEEIISVSFDHLDRGSITDLIDFGIYSNKGNVQFVDKINFFEIISNEEKNLYARIYYTEGEEKDLKATFLIDQSSYDEETGIRSVDLKDFLSILQNIEVEEQYLFFEFPLSHIISEVSNDNGLNIIYSREVLDSIIINTPWIQSGTLWSQLTKIAEACMGRIYCNEEGTITLDTEVNKEYNNKILINPSQILKIENRIENKKTRIPAASISAKKIIKKENQYAPSDAVPFTWYNVKGTNYYSSTGQVPPTPEQMVFYFLYSWANDFNNVATLQILTTTSSGDTGYFGASVSTTLDLPEHTYNFLEPVVNVNIADAPNDDDEYRKTGPYSTDKQSIHSPYNPSKLTIEKSTEKENAVYINCIDYGASYKYPQRLVTDGTITFKCNYFVDDGEEIERYSVDDSYKDGISIIPSNELIQTSSVNRKSDFKIETGETIVNIHFYDGDGDFTVNIPETKEYEVTWSFCTFNGEYAESSRTENMYLKEGEHTVSPFYNGNIFIKNLDRIVYEEKPLSTYILDNIKNKYANGIECFEMEVIVDDYYYSNGKIAIDSFSVEDVPTTFKKNDIVTPYVYRNGIEQPYSLKSDKTPKSFVVIGTSFYYNGFIRQRLYLQEYVE